MAAGDFSPTQLLKLQLKAELMWKDSQLAASTVPHADAAIAVLSKQTARFEVFSNRDKDLEVRVNWIDPCSVVAEDCVESCDEEQPELGTNGKDYKPNICKQSGFSIDQEKFRTNQFGLEETFAVGLQGAKKALDEYWAQQVLVKLSTFAGVNVSNPNYNPVGNSTLIPLLGQNLSSLTQLMQDGMLNRIDNAYFIDNGIFYQALTNAAFDAGNAEGKGAAARLKVFQDVFYTDMWNFLPAGVTEDDVFMINSGAVAMKTVNRNPDTPLYMGHKVGETLYTVNSDLLPGVKYDVVYTVKCKIVNQKKHYFHTWTLKTHGLIELNPVGCPVQFGNTIVSPTGVLSYNDGVSLNPNVG